MREQIELCFIIGCAQAPPPGFEAACVEAATFLCGGCFVVGGTGYWREGKERLAKQFNGRLSQERTLCIKLTTEPQKERQVLSKMRSAVKSAAIRFNLRGAINWVHVQRSKITGLHFSIADELAEAV